MSKEGADVVPREKDEVVGLIGQSGAEGFGAIDGVGEGQEAGKRVGEVVVEEGRRMPVEG